MGTVLKEIDSALIKSFCITTLYSINFSSHIGEIYYIGNLVRKFNI